MSFIFIPHGEKKAANSLRIWTARVMRRGRGMTLVGAIFLSEDQWVDTRPFRRGAMKTKAADLLLWF